MRSLSNEWIKVCKQNPLRLLYEKKEFLEGSGNECQKARFTHCATWHNAPIIPQIFPSEDATVAMPGQATPQFAPLMLLLDFSPAVSAPTLTRLDAPQHLFLMPLVSELKSLMSESGEG